MIVRLDGPIALDTDAYGRTYVGAGGQAANVAAWVAGLGGEGRFLGKRAGDAAGRLAAGELRARGAFVLGPEAPDGTGTVVSIATPDGRRTMLSDRGVAPEFAPHELDAAWLGGCDVLHVPAYSLAREPLVETVFAAAASVGRVTVDASSTAVLTSLGRARFRELVAELSPETVFANEGEAALVEPIDAPRVVVKRGARGCVVRTHGSEHAYPALPADVLDTTGAGDAFAAGFLLGGPTLALEAAARCVAKMGAMP